MRFRRLILLAGLFTAVACGGDGDGGQGPGNGDEDPQGDVLVRNDRFDPATLDVEPGATVVWAWASAGREHNVSFQDGERSEIQGTGTYERTFTEAGAYSYLCEVHGSSMSGVINVAEAAPGEGDGGGGGGDGDGDGGGGYPGY